MSNYYDLITDGGVSPEVDSPVAIQAAMNAAASQRKALLVPEYRFYSSVQLNIPSNLRIQAVGPRSAIWPVANIVLFKADTVDNWAIDGLESDGFGGSPNRDAGYLTISDNGQGFIRIIGCENWALSKLLLGYNSGFAGTVLSPEGGNLNVKKGFIRDVRIWNSYKPLSLPTYGEYIKVSRLVADFCMYGIENYGGNNILSQCEVTNGKSGFKWGGGANNGHGQMIGCTGNHNETNFEGVDVSLGASIGHCHFIGNLPSAGNTAGVVKLTNSRQVNFNGGMMGSNIIVDGGAGTNNGQNSVNGMGMITTYANSAAPSVINGGMLSAKLNTQENGMWAYNN